MHTSYLLGLAWEESIERGGGESWRKERKSVASPRGIAGSFQVVPVEVSSVSLEEIRQSS
jgi:hypothetical protein